MATIPLLIHDTPKIFQYIQTILDFITLAQYILYNEKMLYHIKDAFYRLTKTKITFKQY